MARASRKTAGKSLYSVHPAVTMIQNWIADLKAKSGRSLDEWIALVKASGPADLKACRAWLKQEHGLGTNNASWIAERALPTDGKGIAEDSPETYLTAAVEYVEAMYAGPKAGLRQIYDELLKVGIGIGPETKACPCTTIVPLYRNHVFAQIKPTTRTRIDLGLALKDTKATGRLIDTGGFQKKDRITHCIPITSLEDIDGEVKRWLKIAYDMDSK
jgi:Domain of unknown function (DUF5655)/Domain of unknown function (DUF4287)